LTIILFYYSRKRIALLEKRDLEILELIDEKRAHSVLQEVEYSDSETVCQNEHNLKEALLL
jgi:hypothetical protein